MIVVMEPDATEEEIQNVIKILNEYGFDVHRSTGVTRTVLGAMVLYGRQMENTLRLCRMFIPIVPIKIVIQREKKRGRQARLCLRLLIL